MDRLRGSQIISRSDSWGLGNVLSVSAFCQWCYSPFFLCLPYKTDYKVRQAQIKRTEDCGYPTCTPTSGFQNITFLYAFSGCCLRSWPSTCHLTFPAFCLPSFSAGVHSSTNNDTNLPCKHRVRLCASYHSISWFSNAMQTEKTADMLKLSH
jgi:hypothetical protein